MYCPPTIVPSLFRIAFPLLYILSLLIVSLLLIFESPFLGAVLLGLEDALDLLIMFVLPFAGFCFVYFHPVLGIFDSTFDSFGLRESIEEQLVCATVQYKVVTVVGSRNCNRSVELFSLLL